MRAGDPAQQVEHGEPDRRPGRRRGCRGPAPRRGAPARAASSLRRKAPNRRNSREVDQPQGGVDDDGAQRGRRERREHRAQEQQRQHHRARRRRRGSAAGSGCPTASPIDGAAAAAADREALHQARRQVGVPEGQQLLVGVDPRGRCGARERAAGEDVVGVADERRRRAPGRAGRPRRRRRRREARARAGRPGSSPTTSTPWSWRSKSVDDRGRRRSIPISAYRRRGQQVAAAIRSTASVPRPSSVVGDVQAGRVRGRTTRARRRTTSAVDGTPVSFPSWRTIMITAMPAM